METLILTHGNEVLTIHKDGTRYFATFGASVNGKENMYEMNLTKEDLEKLRNFITPPIEIKGEDLQVAIKLRK